MAEPLLLSRTPPTDPALRFADLRSAGIAYLESIVSDLWTDYNAHDPGITLLELLCYGITDVAHRATFPNADLFAPPPGETPAPDALPFVTARFALGNGPVTIADHRKLFLDRFPELRNVWLDTVTETLFADRRTRELTRTPGPDTVPFEIRGLYHVRALFHDNVPAPRQQEVLAAMRRFFHQHRNLSEDLASVEITPLEDIVVCAEIQLTPGASIEETHAKVIHALRSFLSPVIPHYSLGALVQRGLSPDQIFDGPRLDRGFILDADLEAAGAHEAIYASDLIAVITAVPGVHAVARFRLNRPPRDGVPFDPVDWELAITPGHHPRLTIENARLDFFKGPLPFRSKVDTVVAHLAGLEERAAAATAVSGPFDRAMPAGTWRDLGDFTTLQDGLPLTYGVGRRGFDTGAPPVRMAEARQLQAFLLIFDQLLAGQLAQLTHVRELLSTDLDSRRSTFARAVADLPDLHRLLASIAGDDNATPEQVNEAYTQLIEGSALAHDRWIERRSQILDHLLARFGESFTDHVLAHYTESGPRTEEQLLGAKRTFLASLPVVAYERLKAHDLHNPAEIWDTSNVSGFEKRLGRLLGFASTDRRNLSSIVYEFYEEVDDDDLSEIRFRIVDTRDKRTILSGTRHFHGQEPAEAEMRIAIRLAMDPANYRLKVASDGRHYFVVVHVVDGVEDVVAMRKHFWATRPEAEAGRDRVADLIARQFSEEGMFLVEHLLLRPRPDSPPAWPLLPAACTCSDAPEGADACSAHPEAWDPYSFRIHLIFPGYTTRLAEPGFRRFVEEIVRRELPAHLVARICFVDRDQLAAFEPAYRAWLTALASGTATPELLQPLIDCLNRMHTIHPAGILHDFEEDDDEAAAIVLNRSRLGSLPPDTTPDGPGGTGGQPT